MSSEWCALMQACDEWPARETWIDERGRRCPAPVIALARAARASAGSEVIVVLSDDPAAEFDVPAWCRMTGHAFVSAVAQDIGMAFAVRLSGR